MAYLKIKHTERSDETVYEDFLEFSAISEYSISNIQNVSRFTGGEGNSIIYPVRMHKKGFP